MQLTALNSINFKGNDSIIAQRKIENPEAAAAQEISMQDRIEKYISTVDKANNNVRLATIFSSLALITGIMVKGKKIVNPAANALVTMGETVTSKAAGLIGAATSKLKHKVDAEKMQENIRGIANKLRDVDTVDGKMMGKVSTLVNKIFPNKGESVVEHLKKFGINNKVGLVRNAAVAAVALHAGDKFADGVEGRLDTAEIDKAKRDLMGEGWNVLSDIVGAISQ